MFSKFFSKNVFLPIVIIFLILLFHYSGILTPVEGVISRGLNPVTSSFYSWGTEVKNFFGTSSSLEGVQQEVKELRQENKRLIAENAELKSVKRENEKLREYLDFTQEKEFDQQLARVISQGAFISSRENQERILINKGEDHGIKKDMVVVSSQDIVVGKVEEVNNSTSEVRLVTNEDCELAATIQNKDGTMGITRGELGLTINMDYIPQTEEISIGDKVVTSGLEKNIPPGLVIGEVKKVRSDSNEIWQTATIEPLVELDELTMVSVVTKE